MTDREDLAALVGAFLALTAQVPEIADRVFRAAEIDRAEVEALLKGNDRFDATMWNLCNDSIGAPMEPHSKIRLHLVRERTDR